MNDQSTTHTSTEPWRITEGGDANAALGESSSIPISSTSDLSVPEPLPAPLRYDFGPGEVTPGYIAVSPDDRYEENEQTKGSYGFAHPERVYGRERSAMYSHYNRTDQSVMTTDHLKSSFCIPLGTSFITDLPNGTYQIQIMVGDEQAATHTIIKCGAGKLMLPPIDTLPGQWISKLFTVPVIDNKLQLHITGKAPRLNAVEITAVPQVLELFIAGDSTVTDQKEGGAPYAGWGQMLPALFKHDVCVDNHAISGRSSKSFIDEGRLTIIADQLKAGDFLLIQFGHNDEKNDPARGTEPFTTYKDYLLQYIEVARTKGANPILITPVSRRYFDANGFLMDTHGDYIVAVKELATEQQVPLIDLAEQTKMLLESLGEEQSKSLFVWLYPGEYIHFPDGMEDNTHFQEQGAFQVAQLVAERIRELAIQPLLMYLR